PSPDGRPEWSTADHPPEMNFAPFSMLNPARTTWTAPRFLVDRRSALQVGAAGVVGGLLSAAGRPALASTIVPARAKSVLLVVLSGGPSQLDVWDPKPAGPAEVRGEFSPIATAASGVMIGEHMPLLAQQLGRWSIVRSLKHVEYNHLLAMHVALTGRPTPVPRSGSDLDRVESRSDFPNFAAPLD